MNFFNNNNDSNINNNNNNDSNNINNNNNNDLNNLYNTSYDPNKDFTAGAPSGENNESFKILMGSTNDIREQKPDFTDALIKDYIGQNSDKITSRVFNLSALFFNAFYLFYRKLFSYGILLSIIITVLSYYTNAYIITLLISLACCFGFNPLYVMLVKKRVKKIQLEHPDAAYEQLREYVQDEGGTSSALVIKGIFTNILIAILMVVILITLGIGTTWKKIFNDFNFNDIFSIFKKEGTKEKDFEGTINYDDTVKFDDYFTYTIPNGYKKASTNTYSYNDSCKLSLNSTKDYKAADILIGKIHSFNNADYIENPNGYFVGEIEIKSYNKLDWEGFSMYNKDGRNAFFAIDYKDKVFIIELNNPNSLNECNNHIYELLSTINTK